MDLGLSGKRALVGGASRGIGAAIASALATEEAQVAIVARDAGRLAGQAEAIGGHAVVADLSQPGGPQAAVDEAVQRLGGIELLVVNSGGPPTGGFDQLDEPAWDRALDGTLRSALRLIRAALPYLRNGDQSAILIVLSSSAREPIPQLTSSNVLRPALAGLVKSLVGEIVPVRINGIMPGRIATSRVAEVDAQRAASAGLPIAEVQRQSIARIPLARYGEPMEVGKVGAFLLSPAASYVTGAIVPVDGGMVRALP